MDESGCAPSSAGTGSPDEKVADAASTSAVEEKVSQQPAVATGEEPKEEPAAVPAPAEEPPAETTVQPTDAPKTELPAPGDEYPGVSASREDEAPLPETTTVDGGANASAGGRSSSASSSDAAVLPPSRFLNRDLLQVITEWLDAVHDVLELRGVSADWLAAVTHFVAHGNRKCYGAFDASNCTLFSATTRLSERNGLLRLGVAALPDLSALTLQVFRLPTETFKSLAHLRPTLRHVAITRCRGPGSIATLGAFSWLRTLKLHNAPEVTAAQLYGLFAQLPALVEFDGQNLPAVKSDFKAFVAAAPRCLRRLRLVLVHDLVSRPLEPLAQLPLLEGLWLSGFPHHSTEQLLPLADSFHLRSLQLDQLLTNLPKEPAALGQMRGLLRLCIVGSTITDWTMQVIATLPRVESLCLYQAGRISEMGFEALSELQRLEYLLLGDCDETTAGGLDVVCRHAGRIPTLHALVLHNASRLPDSALAALCEAESRAMLRGLDVQSSGAFLSEEAVSAFLWHQRDLRRVCGSFCPSVATAFTDRGIRIASEIPDPQDLFLAEVRCPLPCCRKQQ